MQLNLDRHPGAFVAVRYGLALTTCAPDAHFYLARARQVAPPVLALRRPDIDEHTVAVLAIADREGVAASTMATSDGDKREPAAQQRMKRRTEYRPHDGIGGAIEQRERCMSIRHGRESSAG